MEFQKNDGFSRKGEIYEGVILMAKYKITAYIMQYNHQSGGHSVKRNSSTQISVNAENQKDALNKAQQFLPQLQKYDYWYFKIDEIII